MWRSGFNSHDNCVRKSLYFVSKTLTIIVIKISPYSLLSGWVSFPVGCVGNLVQVHPSLALWLAISHVSCLSEFSMARSSASSSSSAPASPAVVRLPQRGLWFGCRRWEKANKGRLNHGHTCTHTLTQLNLMLRGHIKHRWWTFSLQRMAKTQYLNCNNTILLLILHSCIEQLCVNGF